MKRLTRSIALLLTLASMLSLTACAEIMQAISPTPTPTATVAYSAMVYDRN